MTNLTKREIVLEIYRKSGFPQKQIVDTVQQTLDIIQRALSEGRNVELRNFGVLEVQVRKQRIGRNPNKPTDTVVIPERAVVKFKSGKILKQQLKNIDLASLERSGHVETDDDADDTDEAAEENRPMEDRPMKTNAETPAAQQHKG